MFRLFEEIRFIKSFIIENNTSNVKTSNIVKIKQSCVDMFE